MIFDKLIEGLDNIEVEEEGFDDIVEEVSQMGDRRVFFVGNGGSAAVASHMAADWGKNGRFAALCLTDGAAVTCLANDLGYERVYSDQLSRLCHTNDLLFAISSSGKSLNIIYAAWEAKKRGANVVTLTGFEADNPLRKEGLINFYVPSHNYGVVEITHLAILHAILDRVMG